MEIERKFLVYNQPRLPRASKLIRQGYLAIDDNAASSVRVRQRGHEHTLTVKAGAQGISRHEVELEISGEEFEELWPLTHGSRLAKRRFVIVYGADRIEFDLFLAGPLDGLMLAEVEFDSVEQAQAFTPPPWFDREVTLEPMFTNAWMARYGNPLHQNK